MVSAWNQNIRLRLGSIESNWPYLDITAFFNRFFLSRSQPDSSLFLILLETLQGCFKPDLVRHCAASDLLGGIRWLASTATSQPLLSIRDETLLTGSMGKPGSPNFFNQRRAYPGSTSQGDLQRTNISRDFDETDRLRGHMTSSEHPAQVQFFKVGNGDTPNSSATEPEIYQLEWDLTTD